MKMKSEMEKPRSAPEMSAPTESPFLARLMILMETENGMSYLLFWID